MARPQRMIRSNPKLLLPIIQVQEARFLTLISFCNTLAMTEMAAIVEIDDVGFKKLLHLAIEDFGVPQSLLAKRLNVSTATMGRWKDVCGNHFPPVRHRSIILEVIVSILREHIEHEQNRKETNDTGGLVTMLQGRIA